MSPIRVLIADDSRLARELLRSILEDEGDIQVIAEAANGRQAIELTGELRPDVVTMDLEMPVLDGLTAIDEIMRSRAVPILVVSSTADANNALEAVNRGALEVVSKPDYSDERAAEFVAKVRLVAGVSVITRSRRRREAEPAALQAPVLAPPRVHLPLQAACQNYPRVFAIACSTGGPQALVHILGQLPADFSCPVLIAQHISDGFAAGMAEWLNGLCRLPVRLAQEGEPLSAGTVHLSPSEQHLVVTPSRRLSLLARGPQDRYRPSCDRLLASVAEVFGAGGVGIILTGMGQDGVAGLAAIRQAGGTTLAQDEASSVIYGMNRVAVDQGAAAHVLPLAHIATAMQSLALPSGRLAWPRP